MVFPPTHQQLPVLISKPYWYVLLPLVLFICACSNSNEANPILEEAHKIHLEAMVVEQEVNKQLGAVDQDSFNLAPFKKRLQSWDENLVEVPGFEDDHHHDHDGHDHHDHDHGKTLDVLPEDMLNIQQEFLDTIKAIQSDLYNYVKKSKSTPHS